MKKIIKIFVPLLFTLPIINYASANNNDETIKVYYFSKYAISEINGYTENHLSEQKILVSKIDETSKNSSQASTQNSTTKSKVGGPLWEITLDQLPISKDECIELEAGDCSDEDIGEMYKGIACKICAAHGPEFAAFDEKEEKLYFMNQSIIMGSGGGFYFLFSADLKNKEIKFLKTYSGPNVSSLSPSGNYLTIAMANTISIYNTKTDENALIEEPNDWTEGNEHLHSLGVVKWIDDTKFIYQDCEYHDKSQESCDQSTQKTYDIGNNKNISSKVISKRK